MRRRLIPVALAAVALLVPALTSTASASPSPTAVAKRSQHVCGAASAGYASCDAIVRTDAGAKPSAAGNPAGLGPPALRAAYSLTSQTITVHPVVAIVDAYDDPNAYTDLSAYRKQYGLTAIGSCAVGGAALCFQKVSQSGTTSYPNANGGWAQEISLDLDMVSAACEECSILLVEASSASFANLAAAEVRAGQMGAKAISNSYGGSESASYASSFSQAGIAITASTGDSGQVAGQSPASYPSVIAVGGTSLTSVSPKVESAWSGAGSFCSSLYLASGAQQKQTAEVAACGTKRGAADIASDADPNTGVAVYDSYAYRGQSGWLVFGGTSASSPFVASAIALAGTWANYGTSGASHLYGSASSFSDVTSGSNGSCTTALCKAGTGWDGPTGLGSLNGTTGL